MMPKRPSLKEITKKNPQVDVKKLNEGIKMLEELRQAGMESPRHRLVPPHARKRISLERSCAVLTDQNA